MLTKSDIPSTTDGDSAEVEHGELTITVRIEHDYDSGEPWENSDGHGAVSDWTKRGKLPGERVLCEDRGLRRYYDYQGAIAIAKRDGWDAPPYLKRPAGEKAARAVDADFNYLRGWCLDHWRYVGVIVEVRRDSILIGGDSLWGVESLGDYWREVAADLANEIMRAEDKESAERSYWAARDVHTIGA